MNPVYQDIPIGQKMSPELSAMMSMAESQKAQPCDLVYYGMNSLMKQECPTQFNNRTSISFQSLTLPSNGNSLQIPNISILDCAAIRMTLPDITAGQNISLNRSWGYSLLQRIDYKIGSGTTYSVSGKQHFFNLVQRCETLDKIEELMELGGAAVVSTAGGVTGIEATCVLSLPFLRVRELFGRKPLDLSMLSSPIQITLYLNPISSIAGGTDAGSYASSGLSSGQLLVRLGDFVEPDASLAGELRNNPNSSYEHLINFGQDQSFPITNSSTNSASPTTVTLTGFRAGSLLSIMVFLLASDRDNPGGNGSKNPFDTTQMRNLTLTYNGQVIYQSFGRSADVFGCLMDMKPSFAPNLRITGTTTPFTTASVKSYYYEIPISQMSSQFLDKAGVEISGIFIGQNVLTLSFTTPTSITGTLYATYFYKSAINITAGGARSDLLF